MVRKKPYRACPEEVVVRKSRMLRVRKRVMVMISRIVYRKERRG
jgi:hypothetical protein